MSHISFGSSRTKPMVASISAAWTVQDPIDPESFSLLVPLLLMLFIFPLKLR